MPLRFAPRDWPIALKMAMDLLVASLVPLAIAVWITSARANAALEREARENVELLARVTATQLEQLLIDAQRSLAQLAGQPAVIAYCADVGQRPQRQAAADEQLGLTVSSNPDYASAFLIDMSGYGLASTSASNVGLDFNFREYFRQARDGAVHISDVLVGKTSSRPGIYLSMPVLSGHGQVGVAVIKYQGERLWQILDAVQPGGRGHAMLTDADGIVLVQPDKSRLYRSLVPLSADEQAALDPMSRWSIERIDSLDLPELGAALGSPMTMGAVEFGFAPDAEGRRERWIAGLAPMSLRPWVVSVLLPRSEFAAPMTELIRSQWAVVVTVGVLAAAYALVRARTLVRPVLEITRAAGQVATGNLDARVNELGEDEIGQLARGFNAMVPRLRQTMEMKQSLAVAMEVQQSLLPSAPPSIPGIEIVGQSRYCDETGGDYFDFIDVSQIEPGKLLFAVGDVMGHGIGSAFIMASARAALRSHAGVSGSLGSLLEGVNRVLAADARDGRFMTLALLVIDPATRSARWASAGHDPAIIYDPASDTFESLDGGDVPLGVVGGVRYDPPDRNRAKIALEAAFGARGDHALRPSAWLRPCSPTSLRSSATPAAATTALAGKPRKGATSRAASKPRS
jgi:HAMP domain-containing protein